MGCPGRVVEAMGSSPLGSAPLGCVGADGCTPTDAAALSADRGACTFIAATGAMLLVAAATGGMLLVAAAATGGMLLVVAVATGGMLLVVAVATGGMLLVAAAATGGMLLVAAAATGGMLLVAAVTTGGMLLVAVVAIVLVAVTVVVMGGEPDAVTRGGAETVCAASVVTTPGEATPGLMVTDASFVFEVSGSGLVADFPESQPGAIRIKTVVIFSFNSLPVTVWRGIWLDVDGLARGAFPP